MEQATTDESRQIEKYMAVFHCCTSIPEEGYERWDEEFHIFEANSIEEALAKAHARAEAQGNEFINMNGHTVRTYAAQVADVQPFMFQGEEEAVYIRNFIHNRPPNCTDFDVAGHYIAIILEEGHNTVTGGRFYNEETYLIYGKTEQEARTEAQERANSSFTLTNDMGERLEYTRKLIEFIPMIAAPKHSYVYSRFFRDKAAYDAFIGAVSSERPARKIP